MYSCFSLLRNLIKHVLYIFYFRHILQIKLFVGSCSILAVNRSEIFFFTDGLFPSMRRNTFGKAADSIVYEPSLCSCNLKRSQALAPN